MRNLLNNIGHFIGIEANRTSHQEKWISGLGGFVGIFAVTLISRQYFEPADAAWIVASMGATAVLVFAVPHGPLSQPWAVIGGHVVSAMIGVTCARWIPDVSVAAAASVALAIGCMHYLRCIHPPGGATALTAVVGSNSLHEMGYQYVLTPTLLNAVTIVVIAITFNALFHWRRYPVALGLPRTAAPNQAQGSDELDEEELDKALQAMNSTVDISGRTLAHIYRLARQDKTTAGVQADELIAGRCYSNGQYGADWQVRQIIDVPATRKSADDLLIYKVVAGANRRKNATTSFREFAQWAEYEVIRNENSWQRRQPSAYEQKQEMIHEQIRCKKATA